MYAWLAVVLLLLAPFLFWRSRQRRTLQLPAAEEAMQYYEYVSSFSGQTTGLARVKGQLYQRFDRDQMRWIEAPRIFRDMSGLGGGGMGDYRPIRPAQAQHYVMAWGGKWNEA